MTGDAMNICEDNVEDAVTDRFDELHGDMEDGFLKLRKNVEEMDADELRRDISNLMMIGNTQMDVIRHQSREIEEMKQDLTRMYGERNRIIIATENLMMAMGVAYDVEDDCPAKWLRMAASVARERSCEPFTATIENLGTNAVTDIDRRESATGVAMVVILGVFVLCVIVWTALMVAAWA